MNISEISGTMVSDPSTATNQIIVDTGDGLQRAIATSAVSGTIVSDESIETTDCIVDTGSGLQKAVKVAGSGGGGGGGGSSTKYGATIDNFIGDVDSNGVLQAPSEEVDLVFSGVKDIAEYGLYYAFFGNFYLPKSISFPDLESLSNGHAMAELMHSSRSIDGHATTTLKSLSFPKLSSITGVYALQRSFYGASGLTSVSFPVLSVLSGYNALQEAFSNCYSLTSISFPALTSSSFGTRTNQFNNMLPNVTGCTVHFPSNLQSVIGSWSDVTAGFGGTNTTVLYDLPATE